MTVEVSSIRKCIQLNFDEKCFVFDPTRMRHIYSLIFLMFHLFCFRPNKGFKLQLIRFESMDCVVRDGNVEVRENHRRKQKKKLTEVEDADSDGW